MTPQIVEIPTSVRHDRTPSESEEVVEFLTDMVTNVPEGTEVSTLEETKAREAERAAELAAAGHLLRLWKPPAIPGEWRTLGLFRADNEQQLQEVLATLPLHVWMTVTVTPLTVHPNDPASKE